jgi:hypothetical protein
MALVRMLCRAEWAVEEISLRECVSTGTITGFDTSAVYSAPHSRGEIVMLETRVEQCKKHGLPTSHYETKCDDERKGTSVSKY